MQGVESFLEALTLYLADNILIVVFLIAVIYFLKKSNQKQRNYIIAVGVTAILLVFNGITFSIVKRMGEDTTYYRFFWLCPVVLLVAYLLVDLLFHRAVKCRQKFLLTIVFFSALLVNYEQSYNGWINIPSNMYQIDEDIIQLADMIDEHTGGERTVLLANDDISNHIREYNARIILNPDGKFYLDTILHTDNINYSARYLTIYMHANRAQYIAIEKERIGTNRLFQGIGSIKIGSSDNYNLYYLNHTKVLDEYEMLYEVEEKYGLYVSNEYVNVPGMSNEKEYLYVADLWSEGVSEEERESVITWANERNVDALIINSTLKNRELSEEFLEEQLRSLQVPYIYNNQGFQKVEEKDFSIVCMMNNVVSAENIEDLRKCMESENPVIMVMNERVFLDNTDREYVDIITDEKSPVVEIIMDAGGDYKEMLNENIMQYSGMGAILLRVKGLEAE